MADKVTVPKFIAEFIEDRQKTDSSIIVVAKYDKNDRCVSWLLDNEEDFFRAWYDGYETENEQRYYLKFKNYFEETCYINMDERNGNLAVYSKKGTSFHKTKFTKEELEELGDGAYYKVYVNNAYKYTFNDLKKFGYTKCEEKNNTWEWINPVFELIEVEKEK